MHGTRMLPLLPGSMLLLAAIVLGPAADAAQPTAVAAAPAAALARPSSAGPGVHVLPAMAMPGLDRQRIVRLYLPPGYAGSRKRYRVLYMHDAQNLFDDATSFVGEWGVDESMDRLAAEGIELIVVGVDHGGDDHRIHELRPWPDQRFGKAEADAYLAFLVERLKPYIDRHYRTRPGRRHTGIMGSSLGGLTSHYALHRYPAVFGRAGVLSPAYWVAPPIYEYVRTHPAPRNTRLYLLTGGQEGEQQKQTLGRMGMQLRSASLAGLAFEVRADGEHNERFWRREFPDAVRFLFGAH